jgi:hypothetical protein
MAETCLGCGLVHANTVRESSETPEIDQLQDCIAAQKVAVRMLLSHVGKKASCDGPDCGKTIYWIRHSNGKLVPYTEAGLNHFVDCVDRVRFQRARS